MFEGAGHGFLRAQSGRDGANLRAAQKAWPRMLAFLRNIFEGRADENCIESGRCPHGNGRFYVTMIPFR